MDRANDRLANAAQYRATHSAARPRAADQRLHHRADFTFDRQGNAFICPAGKQLRSTGSVREDGTMPYWASTKDCRACALKPRCTKGVKRIATRNLFEAEREQVCALKETKAFEGSARKRRKVEMGFAHLKRNLCFRQLRLREITGAADEFLLAATVQNLKKLARFIGGRRQHQPIAESEPEHLNHQLPKTDLGDRSIFPLQTEPSCRRSPSDSSQNAQPPSPEFFNGILKFCNGVQSIAPKSENSRR
jgi:hypothetical protein